MSNQFQRDPSDRLLGQDRYGKLWKEKSDRTWERQDGKTSNRKPSALNPFYDIEPDQIYQNPDPKLDR